MSIIPFWSETPGTPSRRFLRWLAIAMLVSSVVFTVWYALLTWNRLDFLVAGGFFVLMSLCLVVYAWRFAPADLGRQPEPLVRSGQSAGTSA